MREKVLEILSKGDMALTIPELEEENEKIKEIEERIKREAIEEYLKQNKE